MNKKYIDAYIMISFALTLLICLLVAGHNIKEHKRIQWVTKTDTVVQKIEGKIDTIVKTRIKIKNIYHEKIDTVYLYDSIAIDSAYTKAIQDLRILEGKGYFKY